ncbi:MAG: DUF2076 family protein [Phenylobacterium sp.]
MTPDERSILQSFLADLGRTPNVTKDPEAEAMIQDAVRANPDAAYLLVQHAILADQALHAAQAQLAGRAPSSFLSPASTSVPATPTVAPADAPAMAPTNVWGERGGMGGGSGDAPYGGGGYGGPWAGQGGGPIQSSPFAANSGLGGFLRGAGQMAVGVAAGDFLFQGIENIFSPRW